MMPARDPWPLAPALSSPTALASPSSRSTLLLSPPLLTMARGVLRPSLRPRLIPTFFMVDTTDMASAMDTDTATPMATMATTERGVLRPSLRPRPIPTFFMADTTDMVSATDTAMDTPTDTDTTARGVLMLIPLLLPPLSDTPMPFLTPPP